MDISSSFALLLLATLAVGGPTSPIISLNGNNPMAREFNNTAVLTKIIPSTDISSRDAIYITPELLFVGKSNGEILRCLFLNPSVCEMFYSYSYSAGATAIALSGEYLYASLDNGIMLRCSLHEKNSCEIFNDHNSEMNALTISGGYIHAGMQDGRLLRCELHKPNTCRNFNEFKSAITCLVSTDTYIYVGLESKEVWRCSISSENSCRKFISGSEFSSYLKGLLVVKNVYGVTKDGTLWDCAYGYPCTSNSLPKADYTYAMKFDGVPFMLQSSNIWLCQWGNFSCMIYDHHEGALSMSFAYSTYKMQDRFTNEDKTCLSVTRCPPFMNYYKVDERPILEVFVKDGKLYNSQGVLVDTKDADVGKSGRAAIFAMGPDGQILLSNVHNSVLKTSSLFAGHPVASVGEIVVEEGVIKSIRACSDHYRPDVELNGQIISVLEIKGYMYKIESLPCCKENECSQVNVEESTSTIRIENSTE